MMEMTMKVAASAVASLGAVIGTLYSGMQWVDNRFANKDDMHLIELRLEQKIQQDRVQQIQQRIWQIEDRYREKLQRPENQDAYDEYRKLKSELEGLKAVQQEMEREIKKRQFGQ